MKPAICHLCKRDCRSENFHTGGGGDYVKFADFIPLPQGACGHPQGLEWFCYKHLPSAQVLTYLPEKDALEKLNLEFGEFPPYESNLIADPELWMLDIGPNKYEVFSIIRQAMNLNPAEAKNLLAVGKFKIAEGWPSQFKVWQEALQHAKATVEIRYP